MKINTVYRACEGEGVFIGAPQVFVRTQGCSLHCKNCDTLNSWNPDCGIEMSIEEIVSKVAEFGLQRVSITGGNPLEANGVALLIKRLAMSGYTINIEATGQDFDKEVFDRVDFISCDIKPPSTEVRANLENIKLMLGLYRHKMQIKIVCATDEDLDFIVQCYRELESSLGCCHLVITPCYTERANDFDYDMIKKALNRVMDEKLNVRVIMQQHKVVFGSQRGDV